MPSISQLHLPGEVFNLDGHSGFVITPGSATNQPREWVWYAPVLGKHPDQTEKWMFQRFVDRGFAIAGIDVGESSGSPAGRHVFSSLYEEVVSRRGFAKRARLLARSRGGLMLYNWAAEHAECVARVAGIYPVCDLRSYPGLDNACATYGITEAQLSQELDAHNPVARLAPLAQHQIPIFHIHGDSDHLVPLDANSRAMKAAYDALGGDMTLRIVEGGGHTLWRGWFESQELVDFLTAA